MSFIKKPLLAAEVEDPEKLNFAKGFLATPKIDGIRCLSLSNSSFGRILSRTFKPIPNGYVRTRLEAYLPKDVDIDGELTVLEGSFQDTTSNIMREDSHPFLFTYHVFDMLWDASSANQPYTIRSAETIRKLGLLLQRPLPFKLSILKPELLTTFKHFERYEKMVLNAGFEGVMLRRPYGTYKFGRSTLNEEILLKCKRFRDSEAEIVGFVQGFKNINASMPNNLGYSKKSMTKSGRKLLLQLGAFEVRDPLWPSITFSIGTGFTIRQREEFWYKRKSLLGKTVRYKFQHVGVKHAPRCPSFLGFRED